MFKKGDRVKLNDEQFTSIKYPKHMYSIVLTLIEKREGVTGGKEYWMMRNQLSPREPYSAYEKDLVPYRTKDIIGILNKK